MKWVLLLLLATPVQAAEFNLCWVGSNGYTVTGRFTINDSAMDLPIVTEADVSRFKISGYHNGTFLGSWDMRTRAPDATWFFRFDPQTRQFPSGELFGQEASQGWNADGAVVNCGNPGFGFNAGDYSQDICVNGIYIRDSSVLSSETFVATTGPVTPTCDGPMPMSKSTPRGH